MGITSADTMMKASILLLLGSLSICASVPLGMITHQGVVMALHGIIDHLSVQDIRTERDKASQILRSRLKQHGSPWRIDDIKGDELFTVLDTDGDQRLMASELGGWMWAIVRFHVEQMKRQASDEFFDAGGTDTELLDWPTSVASRDPNGSELSERIDPERLQQAFFDADTNEDGLLTLTEYQDFSHPMFCKTVMRRYAVSFIERQDGNGDGLVNVSEFLSANLRIKEEGDDRDSVQAYEHRAEEQERLREFKSDFDVNGDEHLDSDEVARLLDPLFETHFLVGAFDLGMVSDSNGDHELDSNEVKMHYQSFRDNHMLDFGRWVSQDAGKDLDAMYTTMTERLIRHGTRHKDEL